MEFPDEIAALEEPGEDAAAEGRLLERTLSLDVFGDTLVISDLEGLVHVFSLDGEHLRALGGPRGSGPAVLMQPRTVRFAPDGSLWVNDAGLRRVIRFSPALEVAESVPTPARSTGSFVAYDPVLGPVTSSATPGFVLTAYGDGENRVDIPSDVPVPEELTEAAGRASGFLVEEFMVASAGIGQIIMLDGNRLRLWRVGVEYDPARVVTIQEIPLPRWFLNALRADMDRRRELWAHLRAEPSAFNTMRVSPDGVWLEPGGGAGIGVLGVLVPLDGSGGARETVLWRGDLPPGGRRSLMRDGVVHLVTGTSYARYELREVDGPP